MATAKSILDAKTAQNLFARIFNGQRHPNILTDLATAGYTETDFICAIFDESGAFVEFADLSAPRQLQESERMLIARHKSFSIEYTNYEIGNRSFANTNRAVVDQDGGSVNTRTTATLKIKRDDAKAIKAIFDLCNASVTKMATMQELITMLTNRDKLVVSDFVGAVIQPLVSEEGAAWLTNPSSQDNVVEFANKKMSEHYDKFGVEVVQVQFKLGGAEARVLVRRRFGQKVGWRRGDTRRGRRSRLPVR